MEEILEHIADEGEIKIFHGWISELCNPDSNIVQDSEDKFKRILKTLSMPTFPLGTKGESDCLMTSDLDRDGQKLLRGLANKYNCFGNVLKGKFKIRHQETDAVFEGFLDAKERPHGFCRVISPNGDVDFYGCFVNGSLVGNCWKSLIGGSFMVSDRCNFAGENTIYFYPDCRTAIVGAFGPNGHLQSGHVTEIIGVEKDAAHNPEPVFLAPDTDGPVYERDISTNECICKQPMVPDPYEDLFVFVSDSLIPGAGQGLFAKTLIEADTVISFYNGTRFDVTDATARENSSYKITFDDSTDLDIPEDMTDVDKYRASLGHKVCHSFTPNCEFDNFDHPRFGPIKCIVTLRPLAKGEELTVHYQYDLAIAPAWYKKLWARHQKNLRGMPNWKLALAFKDAKLGSPKVLRHSLSSGSSSRSASECFSGEVIQEESEEELLANDSVSLTEMEA